VAFIELKGLTKHFDGRMVGLDHLDLQISQGEFLVILGSSGCGKSTLLRLIAGLEQPTEGDIMLDGKSMLGVPPKNRNVAMVFQEYALYPHLTVKENLAFPLKMKQMKRAVIESAIADTAKLVGLSELLARKPKQLSGGQRQRVALGRALIRQPKVFFFDEPLSNLDYNLRVSLRREIAELHRQTKITMVYVTHDQQEALALGDRIGVMREGKLIQCSIPDELISRPINAYIAGFIGNPRMNMLEGMIDQNLKLIIGQREVCDLSQYGQLSAFRNMRCMVGMRAHHIKLADRNSSYPANSITIPAVLKRIENQGDSSLAEFDYDESILMAKIPEQAELILESTYHLIVEIKNIMLFHHPGGERFFP